MVNQDTIADLISRLKNSTMAGNSSLEVPHSNFKEQILACLKGEGFIKSFSVEQDEKGFKFLRVEFSGKKEKFSLKGVRRMSKPSRRIYKGFRDIFPRVGRTIIVSTPQGVMTARSAKRQKMGGEELFEIW